MEFLKKHSWAIWNGAGTGICFGYFIESWQWWAFCVIMIILVGWSKSDLR